MLHGVRIQWNLSRLMTALTYQDAPMYIRTIRKLKKLGLTWYVACDCLLSQGVAIGDLPTEDAWNEA